MSIEILFHWEKGWMLPQFDIQLWDDLAQAFNVVKLYMIPNVKINAVTALEAFDNLKDFFDKYRTEKKFVFLIPRDEYENAIDLKDYKHPSDCVYIFGASYTYIVDSVTENDDVVCVDTPISHQIWQWQVAGMVLYDRIIKGL